MQFSTLDIFSIIALLLGFLYNFQILTLKNRTQATNYFSIYLFNITFIILFFFLLRMKMEFFLKYTIPILNFSVLIMPISLWIYLKKITQAHDNNKLWKHFVAPTIASVIVFIMLMIVTFSKNKELSILVTTLLISYVYFIMTVGFLVLNIIYLILSFRLLKKHQKIILNYYSFTHDVDFKWVRLMLYTYIFLLFGLIISNISTLEWTNYVFYGVLIVYIVFIGHNALKQKDIWEEEKLINKNSILSPDNNSKEEETQEVYTEAQLEMFKLLKVKLVNYMLEEKPYLDQDLSILKLAKELGTNSKYLSHIINTEFNQNFINFINEQRIQDVKSKLEEGNLTYTIEALSQNAGFKSKSSFNAAFRKFTGQTPTEYLSLSRA